MSKPVATVTLADRRSISLQLEPRAAANTVANFAWLAGQGYFDGYAFTRSEATLAQATPRTEISDAGIADWLRSPGWQLPTECAAGGFDNPLGFRRGSIGMALGSNSQVSSAASWFIMSQDVPAYDDKMPAFGRVIDGMEIVDELCALETRLALDIFAQTLKPVEILTVRVDTNGIDFGEPVKAADVTDDVKARLKDPEAFRSWLQRLRDGTAQE